MDDGGGIASLGAPVADGTSRVADEGSNTGARCRNVLKAPAFGICRLFGEAELLKLNFSFNLSRFLIRSGMSS